MPSKGYFSKGRILRKIKLFNLLKRKSSKFMSLSRMQFQLTNLTLSESFWVRFRQWRSSFFTNSSSAVSIFSATNTCFWWFRVVSMCSPNYTKQLSILLTSSISCASSFRLLNFAFTCSWGDNKDRKTNPSSTAQIAKAQQVSLYAESAKGCVWSWDHGRRSLSDS